MKTYTFSVDLPGLDGVWRKIELAGNQTLEDLHWAIQEAFEFDGAHLYSFFMSGIPWDRETEYALPEDALDWDEEEGEGDDTDTGDSPTDFAPGSDQESLQAIRDSLGKTPSPQSVEEMLGLVSSDPELRGQMVQLMSDQFGVPAFMADMLLKNASSLMSMLPEGMLESMFAPPEPAADVREVSLASLELAPEQEFLYLFDYGDKWQFQVRVDQVNPEEEPGVEYPRLVEAVGEAPVQYSEDADEFGDDEGSEVDEEGD